MSDLMFIDKVTGVYGNAKDLVVFHVSEAEDYLETDDVDEALSEMSDSDVTEVAENLTPVTLNAQDQNR